MRFGRGRAELGPTMRRGKPRGSFRASGREPVEYVCGRNLDKRAAADFFGDDERDRAAHRFFVALYDI